MATELATPGAVLRAALGLGSGRRPALHRAARRGDVGGIRRALADARRREGRDEEAQDDGHGGRAANGVDARDRNGSTALMHAAERRHAKAVEYLLEAGADPTARNSYGWSAYEYHCEAESAGVTAPYVNAALAALLPMRARAFAAEGRDTYARLVDAGARDDGETVATFAVRAGDAASHVRFVRDGGSTLERAAADTASLRAALGYAVGAGNATLGAMRGAVRDADADTVRVGGEAVPGVTARRLGMFAGVRYDVRALEWRPRGARYARGEPRVAARELGEAPPMQTSPAACGGWEMIATLAHPACTPWGAIEVNVDAVQLHSIASELAGATRVGAGAAALPLLLTAYALPFRVVDVEGPSMLPTLYPHDIVLVDTRAGTVRDALEPRGKLQPTTAPVVWLDAPNALRQIARDAGRPEPPRGARLFKRLVASGGDAVAIKGGAVSINGVRESPRPHEACVAVPRERPGCAPEVSYDVGPGVVPPGAAFVLGDNRGASTDSALFGAVRDRSVRGVARWTLLPPAHWGPVR